MVSLQNQAGSIQPAKKKGATELNPQSRTFFFDRCG